MLIALTVVSNFHCVGAQTLKGAVLAASALSAPPQAPAIYPSGANVSIEMPQALTPALKFRDPSKALTLGEISDMQAQKANADILRKFGYTDVEPIRPKPIATTLAKPSLVIKTLAVWGKPDSLRAELLVNGVLYRVTGREVVAPNVRVTRVRAGSVDLEYDRPVTPPKSKPRKGATPASTNETLTTRVSVGQSLEIPQ